MSKLKLNIINDEIDLWKDLQLYVQKNMEGKTLTHPLNKEIDSMITERKNYLNNLIN